MFRYKNSYFCRIFDWINSSNISTNNFVMVEGYLNQFFLFSFYDRFFQVRKVPRKIKFNKISTICFQKKAFQYKIDQTCSLSRVLKVQKCQTVELMLTYLYIHVPVSSKLQTELMASGYQSSICQVPLVGLWVTIHFESCASYFLHLDPDISKTPKLAFNTGLLRCSCSLSFKFFGLAVSGKVSITGFQMEEEDYSEEANRFSSLN